MFRIFYALDDGVLLTHFYALQVVAYAYVANAKYYHRSDRNDEESGREASKSCQEGPHLT